ncbi:MAG: LON peptidase substrate-binding domain-containing protein [Pseudomonadota bacterium]
MPSRRVDRASIPQTIPVFPLPGALLLPRGQMPLNIFEPRYLAMVDAALGGARVIGMVQPRTGADGAVEEGDKPGLSEIGCAGRITSFAETDDGRYVITLTGLTRFRVIEELDTTTPYRQAQIDVGAFEEDRTPRAGEDTVDRKRLLETFRAYLEANELQADWDSVNQAGNESLVNALAMLSPYGPREKQALLEAPDLATRAELLIAITELSMAEDGTGEETTLQ